MTKEFFDKLYEILAIRQFNSERPQIVESVLKTFLAEEETNVDVLKEARKVSENKVAEILTGEDLDKQNRAEWFKESEKLISNIPGEYVPEYVYKKFIPFGKEFNEKFGFELGNLLYFSLKLSAIIEERKWQLEFDDLYYAFKSREEHVDLGLVARPSKEYIEKWSKIITFAKEDFSAYFSEFPKTELEKTLKTLSLDFGNLPEKDEIRLYLTPLLKIENKIIVISPRNLISGLAAKYELLLKQSESYLNSKGREFEKLVQNTLRQTPFQAMEVNVNGGSVFEVDAVLRFKKSFWAVQVSSRPPSLPSLKGDLKSIRNDLSKTIKRCIKQGKIAIANSDHENLKHFTKKARFKGIIVVLDGIYPQLNINTLFEFFKEDIPVYAINWFDLRKLIDQQEIDEFEDFLLWRCKRPMPIICHDETDYWAFYFDHYKQNDKFGKRFEIAQKQKYKIFYISQRFNNKDYLREIVKNEK